MKILLRDRQTGLYYSSLQPCAADPEEAHDFKQSSCAIQHAGDHQWPEAEVVYYFGDVRESVSLPILPRGSGKGSPCVTP